MRYNTPEHRILRIRFCTLAGVKDLRLTGKEISGRWESVLIPIYGPTPKRLVEDFANWSSEPNEILRFTRKYGPLASICRHEKRFSFTLGQWRSEQRGLQSMWEGLSPQPQKYLGVSVSEKNSGVWSFWDQQLTYRAANLGEFLYLDLFSCPVERLRKCLRPDCPNPYFIARHLKQKYCRESCANWAQTVWKKQWWQKNGKKWRAKKVRSNKGGS
jgi:hypothetical protein